MSVNAVDKAEHIHFVGICGVGMAGLAYLLKRLGYQVSGCDVCVNELGNWLQQAGVHVQEGHEAAHVTDTLSCLVVTPAVPADAPELLAAQRKGIPIIRRGELLAAWMSAKDDPSFYVDTSSKRLPAPFPPEGRCTVAICGTHGKTTTSCFTTRLLQEQGLSPSWCIGGSTRTLGAVAGANSGALLVSESDESDGTLARYHPSVTVLMNLDLDHLEHFAGEDDLFNCFRRVIAQTTQGVAVCADHARALAVAKEAAQVPLITFGFAEQADVRASCIELTDHGSSFDLHVRGVSLGRLTLPVSGQHNILNALGAASAALLVGVPPDRIAPRLPVACSELPGRRFEEMGAVNGARYVADYAHHPQELKAAIHMARLQRPRRLMVVFQPHRYTRTLALGPEFPAAFADADEVILLPVYAASEKPLLGGDTSDLYRHFRSQLPGKPVALARSRREAWHFLKRWSQPGDLVLIAGAGDIIKLADFVRIWKGTSDALPPFTRSDDRVSRNVGIAAWSSYGVGGEAEFCAEVASEEELASLVQTCRAHAIPVHFFGAGANRWISDLGLEGCALRFSKEACRGYREEGGVLKIGCGWRGPALLERLTQDGWSGVEFLEGVPGSVGGWLAMNAGAHGGEVASVVQWVRVLDADGTIRVLDRSEMGFGYRTCKALESGAIALSCGLALTRSTREAIMEKRREIREKRIPLAGLRTAGSVFKNPAGSSAGRLLDQAGCKGLRVGGAYVTDVHANIIAVDEGATASDVLALMQILQARVHAAIGLWLEPEVQGFEV